MNKEEIVQQRIEDVKKNGEKAFLSASDIYIQRLEAELNELKNRSCEGCKHWHSKKVDHPNYRECNNEEAYGVFYNDTNADFCCNKWSKK